MIKTCLVRQSDYATPRPEAKYCGRECYHSVPKSAETRAKMSAISKRQKPPEFGAKVSAALRGKPRPWARGEGNPNYGGKAQTPEVLERMRVACKVRGQVWTAEHRRRHSELMLGPTNRMRGQKHSEKTKKAVSIAKRKQYAEGTIRVKRYKLSEAEFQIALFLGSRRIPFKKQFHIMGVPFLYDFCFPERKLLIEYQGDYWHANPRKYPPGTKLKFFSRGELTVEEVWARDAEKKRLAEENGYEVRYVWEMDYRKRGSELVAEILGIESK